MNRNVDVSFFSTNESFTTCKQKTKKSREALQNERKEKKEKKTEKIKKETVSKKQKLKKNISFQDTFG